MLQWLTLVLLLQKAEVQSLVRELGSHKPEGTDNNNKKKNTKKSKVTTSESLETGMCVTVCYSHKTAFDNDDL